MHSRRNLVGQSCEFLVGTAVALSVACGGGAGSQPGAEPSLPSALTSIPSNSMGVIVPIDPGFGWPSGIAVDGAGNMYVADRWYYTVRKITAAGVVTTLAGTAGVWGTADGTGAAAQFSCPDSIAVDAAGNVYVGEAVNVFGCGYARWPAVRKITPDGVVSTIGRWTTDGLAVDGYGNVFVADASGPGIYKMTPDGVISLFAGTPGVWGYVDGAGTEAQFSWPYDVAIDGQGNLYVADTSNRAIRKVTPDAVVTTLAWIPDSPIHVAVDGSGNVYAAGWDTSGIWEVTPDGVVPLVGQWGPEQWGPALAGGLTADASGNLYATDTLRSTILKILPDMANTSGVGWSLPDGVITLFAGGVPGSNDGTIRHFGVPMGAAVDGAGNVYVADSIDVIHKITPEGVLTTLAGMAGVRGSVDGTGSSARFNSPQGVALDGSGNLYVADTFNNTIRKISPDGVVTTLAGTGGVAGSADGTGAAARFYSPIGIAVDGSGNVYVADSGNDTIREITPDGVVTTLAGTVGLCGSADGTSTAAQFCWPEGVAVSGQSGMLYIADSSNCTIRQITPEGRVMTLAGTAGVCGNADGAGAAAQFNDPIGVALDASGSIYVADSGNSTIRKITGRMVTTVVGVPGDTTNVPGPLPTSIAPPWGVAVDPTTTGTIVFTNGAGLMEVVF